MAFSPNGRNGAWVGALLGLASLLPGVVHAQSGTTPDTMIVLDVSNSMWGQIDGVAKIEIAREALGSLLDELPDGGRTGLMVYGHRREGDCSDVELVAPLTPLDRAALKAAAAKVKPKGKTPITEALRQAATNLGVADRPSRLILVSDGIETCSGDPCALAAELARAGVDFKAHVIGFDIASRADQAKIACIASLTGGSYTNARDAAELAEALKKSAASVSQEAPAAKLPELTLTAIDGATGKPIEGPVSWTVSGRESEAVVAAGLTGGTVSLPLPPGAYTVSATLLEKSGGAEASVTDAGGSATVVLDGVVPKASISLAAASAPASSVLAVSFEGPKEPGDFLRIVTADGERLETDLWVRVDDGSPVDMRLPSEPGTYEIVYVWSAGDDRIIARAPLTVVPAELSLELPATVPVGAQVSVDWKGPGGAGDWIGFVPQGGGAGDYAGRYVFVETSPATLMAPSAAGAYEAIYVTGHDGAVVQRKAFEVTEGTSALVAPASAEAGAEIDVTWQGPGGSSDWIGVSEPASPADSYLTWTSPSDPVVRLRLPLTPGAYELRYVLSAADGAKVMAAQALTLTEPDIELGIPTEVSAATDVTFAANGPTNGSNWIGFTLPGAEPGSYSSGLWTGAEDIADGRLTMRTPQEPGVYELRFVLSGPGEPRIAKSVTIAVK